MSSSRPLSSAEQTAQAAQANEVIRKQFEQNLTPEDREVLMKASKTYLAHASAGLWLGSLTGCALAFRKRWTQRPRPPYKSTGAGKMYYPTASAEAGKVGKEVVEGKKAEAPKNDLLGTLVKGFGYGLLGGFVGTSIGMFTGSRAAQKIIKEEGSETMDRLKVTLESVGKDIERLKQGGAMTGGLGGAGAKEGPTPSRGGVVDALEKKPSGELEWRDDTGMRDEKESKVDDGSPEAVVSRWDELRKSRAAPPSSWDKLRETQARAALPPRGDIKEEDGLRRREEGDEGASENRWEDKDEERERRRREFEEMVERERNGGAEAEQENRKWR
ncbi:hypothetical protein MNV49_004462 [Pseudohyphozyma bogoriensis]|nr:hypothetical protein MNV49_004462 [Pseudohyphozyma bogoriensis]